MGTCSYVILSVCKNSIIILNNAVIFPKVCIKGYLLKFLPFFR